MRVLSSVFNLNELGLLTTRCKKSSKRILVHVLLFQLPIDTKSRIYASNQECKCVYIVALLKLSIRQRLKCNTSERVIIIVFFFSIVAAAAAKCLSPPAVSASTSIALYG